MQRQNRNNFDNYCNSENSSMDRIESIENRINGCIWTSPEKYIYGLWGVTEIFKKEKEQNSNALNEDWKL